MVNEGKYTIRPIECLGMAFLDVELHPQDPLVYPIGSRDFPSHQSYDLGMMGLFRPYNFTNFREVCGDSEGTEYTHSANGP